MLKKQLIGFLASWALSTLGMWLCIFLFANVEAVKSDIWMIVLAGLVFSLANGIVRPLAMTLTLPLLVATMGVSTILVNFGVMALTIYLTPGVSMNFWGIVFSTMIMSVINGVINFYVAPHYKR